MRASADGGMATYRGVELHVCAEESAGSRARDRWGGCYLLLSHQPPEPGVLPEGVPAGLHAEDRGGEMTGDGEEPLQLGDGGLVLAHHGVDLGQGLHGVKAPPRFH